MARRVCLILQERGGEERERGRESCSSSLYDVLMCCDTTWHLRKSKFFLSFLRCLSQIDTLPLSFVCLTIAVSSNKPTFLCKKIVRKEETEPAYIKAR